MCNLSLDRYVYFLTLHRINTVSFFFPRPVLMHNSTGYVIKQLVHALACTIELWSTWEVWRALKKLELPSAIASGNSYARALQTSRVLHLTNRFQFAVRLFSYRSQMTSKCGKNKKVAHEPLGEWVTDVLTTF